MKKLPILLIALFAVAGLFAQKSAIAATAEMVQLYSLDAKQEAAMLTVQQRHVKNMGEIQSLKKTDRAMYVKKLKSMQYADDVSIKRILNKEQMDIFYARSVERRKKQAVAAKTMKAAGKSQLEIDEALVKIE